LGKTALLSPKKSKGTLSLKKRVPLTGLSMTVLSGFIANTMRPPAQTVPTPIAINAQPVENVFPNVLITKKKSAPYSLSLPTYVTDALREIPVLWKSIFMILTRLIWSIWRCEQNPDPASISLKMN